MCDLTKDDIIRLLETNDRAVMRALLVLYENQTTDEQDTATTRHHNNRGFKQCHARIGTSMAKFFIKHNTLTEKQVAYWRVRNKNNQMRIACYWRQLLERAIENKKNM